MNNIVSLAEKFVRNCFDSLEHSSLVYHNIGHTTEVVDEVKQLISEIRLSPEEQEILLIAAWFHDTGYLHTYENHEEKSAEICKDFLDSRKYPQDKAARVIDCILATRLPQRPSNLAEEILCDADLSYAGKENFHKRSSLLKKEWELNRNFKAGEEEWLRKNINFLNSVDYFTGAAKQKYTIEKNKNLAELLQRFSDIKNKKLSPL